MPHKEVYLTPEGMKKLEEELYHLRTVRRPQIADRIHLAKEFGNTVDNAEYDEAKNEQAFVEGRILTLENMLGNAAIIRGDGIPSDIVRIGSSVIVETSDGDKEEYAIVGSAEASPHNGKISNESPVGKALLGRKAGEKINVMTPAGVTWFTIVSIK